MTLRSLHTLLFGCVIVLGIVCGQCSRDAFGQPQLLEPFCCWPPKPSDVVRIDMTAGLSSSNSFQATLATVPSNRKLVVTYYEVRSTNALPDLVEDTGGTFVVRRSSRWGAAWHGQRPCNLIVDSCSAGGPFVGSAAGYVFGPGTNVAIVDPTSAGGTVSVHLVGYLTSQ